MVDSISAERIAIRAHRNQSLDPIFDAPHKLGPASRSRTDTILRCVKLLSPPPDLHTGKGIRTSINEPQFVADDGGHELRIGPFNIREQRAFNVPSYDLVRIVG